MKAISIRQPYASQIANGQKTIEVRSWPTRHRGDILICASASPKIEPHGVALCIANLIDCRPMTQADEKSALSKLPPEGAWAWVLADIRLIESFPVRGRLGIYELNASIREVSHPPLAVRAGQGLQRPDVKI